MSEHVERLTSRFGRKAYRELILEHQSKLDDEVLSDETFRLHSQMRPRVCERAAEIYELFLHTPKTQVDFFETPTRHQIEEIVHTAKHHLLKQHGILIKEDEAIAIAHIVTMNYARMCHMNDGFKQHLKNSRSKRLFKRVG